MVKSLFNWAEVEPYSDYEVRAFLAVCEEEARHGFRYLDVRNRAILSLFVATGLRLEELSTIRLSRLDPRLQQVAVTGKGALAKVAPIDGEARKALRAYLQVRPGNGDQLWTTDDEHSMSLYSVKIMVTRVKKRVGVNGGGAHRFRHYFATHYREAGGDINSLRLLLSHATLDMVLKYGKFTNVQKALAQHEQFNPLDRLVRGPGNGRPWRYTRTGG